MHETTCMHGERRRKQKGGEGGVACSQPKTDGQNDVKKNNVHKIIKIKTDSNNNYHMILNICEPAILQGNYYV